MLLQRPGSTIRTLLESSRSLLDVEQVYVEMKVIDRGERQWIDGLTEMGLTAFEMARRCIGRMVHSIDGLRTTDGPWEMIKDNDGYLTVESAEFLIPLQGELITMIGSGATLTPVEKKDA